MIMLNFAPPLLKDQLCKIRKPFQSIFYFSDQQGEIGDEATQLLELLERCNLSSMAHKFQENDVTAEIFWDLDDEALSELKLSKVERMKYNKAKKTYGEKGNSMFIQIIPKMYQVLF